MARSPERREGCAQALTELGGCCPPRHGFAESSLSPEQRGFCLPDHHVGSVAELVGLFHNALSRVPQPRERISVTRT